MLEVMLPRVSNRASWSDVIELLDDETNELIDLSAASIVIEVMDDCGRTVLSATTDNGKVVVVDIGRAQFSFAREEMATLCLGTYRVGATVTTGDETNQIFFGTMPVIDGVVSR